MELMSVKSISHIHSLLQPITRMYNTGSLYSCPMLESNYSTTYFYEHFFQISLISHSFFYRICKCWYRYDFLRVKVLNIVAALLCRSKVQTYSLVHASGVAGGLLLPSIGIPFETSFKRCHRHFFNYCSTPLFLCVNKIRIKQAIFQ